jgi:helicase
MLIGSIADFGARPEIAQILGESGLKELYPPQAGAVESGLFTRRESMVVAAPTASGKTLIAEMAAIGEHFRHTGKTIYLVPLRALAREKYEDFTKKYAPHGLRVMQSTGDFDSDEPWLKGADIVISTNEKLDSLIRHRAEWLKYVSLIIADEVHLLGDPHRGPTLEILLTRMRLLNPRVRIIALSATIPNSDEIAHWLDATLVHSEWRPVPLREGVYFNGAGIFNDGTVKWIAEEGRSDIVGLALDTIRESGQALAFVGTRRSAEATAIRARKFTAPFVDKEFLSVLSKEITGASPEATRLSKRLAECVEDGVAFHHAGILYQHRKLIEDAFRANKIKLLVSTTTLAMGLNLPSRRVIIRDWWRYEPGVGIHSIPVIEVKQMSGRAGRPGYDEYGESLIIARNRRDEQHLFDKYIKGVPERIASHLAEESVLRGHLLSSIAGGFAAKREEILEFLSRTFFAYQMGMDYLTAVSDNVMEFLEDEGMIAETEKKYYHATRFGRRISELYLDPLSAVILRDALSEPKEKTAFPLFHMIARTPDMMALSLKKKDRDELLEVFLAHADTLLLPDEELSPTEEMLSHLKVASILMQWILETPEDKILTHFGIGPGDLRSLIELTDWLLYSTAEIAKVFGLKELSKITASLRVRVQYGVKEELLPLVSLKNIGRVRARSLFDAGFKTLKDIWTASVNQLSTVEHVGRVIAEDIKKQVERKKEENPS